MAVVDVRFEQRALAGGVGEIEVLFISSVEPGLPWKFKPTKRTVTVPIGEQGEASYTTENLSKTATTKGTATFNVTPLTVASFTK